MMETTFGVQVTSAFYRINALRDDQRDAAYSKARERIAGRRPTIAEFQTNKLAKYPREFVALVTGLSAFMVLVAFLPSAIRIHQVALTQFATAVLDVPSQYVAALCVVLMAETGQIIFSLASMRADGRTQYWLFIIASWVSTAIALSGNAVASGDHAMTNAFAFLETFAPPVLTLITASVLKSQIVHSVSDRHVAQTQYDDAIRRYEETLANAHESSAWQRTIANALRDAIRSANVRSSAQLRELTSQDWYALVRREQGAEEWYTSEAQRVAEATKRLAIANEVATVRSGERSTEATGEIASIPTERTNAGEYTKTCPTCGFIAVGDTPRKATNSMVAHQKRHASEAKRSASALAEHASEKAGE